jgi:four helix bundle protein
MSLARSFRELDVYQNAMALAMRIFELSKRFPVEERYSLTDQLRRSSRSVCANISEAWRKRRYQAAFLSKLSDAETEAAETQVWIELATKCGYLKRETFEELDDACDKVIAQLIRMANEADHWALERRHADTTQRRDAVTPTRPHADPAKRRHTS